MAEESFSAPLESAPGTLGDQRTRDGKTVKDFLQFPVPARRLFLWRRQKWDRQGKISLIKIGTDWEACYTSSNYFMKRSGRMKRTAEVQIPEEQLDRTATAFIKAASGYACQISITRGAHCINGKSLLGFLSLMKEGGTVELTAEGGDEEEALETLAGILQVK